MKGDMYNVRTWVEDDADFEDIDYERYWETCVSTCQPVDGLGGIFYVSIWFGSQHATDEIKLLDIGNNEFMLFNVRTLERNPKFHFFTAEDYVENESDIEDMILDLL